ncbi:MAG TPA: chemotaxis protein CheW [Candidatus Hydrogenedentes bacterium]|nr:chemotaxis protein CheW [Candidatus Hydrogenedentota bacterium]HPG67214.1 chemotaxis protein CheW [Candidatus Hydrogenedentota bacterium]
MSQEVKDMEGAAALAAAQAGKYLTFLLGKETYGLPILKVQEIIKLIAITSVPRTPEFVRGVINLRGKVIPVVDLRRKFGMESIEDTERTCIIVMEVVRSAHAITMGALVDAVSEVIEVTAGQIEPPPTFSASVRTDFIRGMGKLGEKVVVLLDVDKVMTEEEVAASCAMSD